LPGQKWGKGVGGDSSAEKPSLVSPREKSNLYEKRRDQRKSGKKSEKTGGVNMGAALTVKGNRERK